MNKHKLCSNVVYGTVNVSFQLVPSRLLSAAHVLTICPGRGPSLELPGSRIFWVSFIARILQRSIPRHLAACWPHCTPSSQAHCHSRTNAVARGVLCAHDRSHCTRASGPRTNTSQSGFPFRSRRSNSDRCPCGDEPVAPGT